MLAVARQRGLNRKTVPAHWSSYALCGRDGATGPMAHQRSSCTARTHTAKGWAYWMRWARRSIPSNEWQRLFESIYDFAESVNNKIQLVKSRARGYRTYETFRVAILFYCGNLDLYPRASHYLRNIHAHLFRSRPQRERRPRLIQGRLCYFNRFCSLFLRR